MARIELANVGWKVKITPSGGWTPAAQGDIVWTVVQAIKVKVLGKFALLDKITWQVPLTKCVFAGYTHSTPGAPTLEIMKTAIKCKADGKFVLRKGDQGACAGAFTLNVPPYTVVPCACTFVVDDPGQTKVLGE